MRAVMISLLLLIVGLAALFLYDPAPPGPETVPSTAIADDSFRWEPEATPADDAPDKQNGGIRPISPKQFAQPFTENSAELERIQARPPTVIPGESEDTGPGGTPLFRPKVAAAGLIRYEEGTLQLGGIDLVLPGDMCTAPDGSHWPCGVIARTAFRNYLRGRALTCITPGKSWDDTLVTTCLLHNQDPAAWLASHGWAKPKPGGAYEEMAGLARNGKKGIYGTDPRKAMPDIDSRVSVTLLPTPAEAEPEEAAE